MTEKITLYYNIVSPPACAVLLCGAELGIEFNLKEIDLFYREHKKPEFIKKNPQHTVPLIEDDGVFIADSHAICAYLVGKYGKSDSLYPKDLVKRALVDSRLHFDSGHMFCRLRMLFEPVFFNKEKNFPDDRINYIRSQYEILNRFLENSAYVCGDVLTIADFCLVATATSLTEIVPFDPVAHANVLQWIDRLAKLPYYEQANGTGARDLQAAVKGILAKNQSS
uniref:glutathione transferase n=1 Tax=Mayetiola destructor TaxID=39758 RepID=Q6R1L0_MAYDE|nr:glutathione S-transferase [Mayetiola destructor]AAS00666.1 glutathion S-transferase [Mayetiola destructor]